MFNKKFILLKECLLKYWDITNNILLYQTIFQKNYPFGFYFIAISATLTSFARLMLKFRRIDISSIKCIMIPMLPCEACMCDERDDGTYNPSQCRILLCCGWLIFLLWIWYAILIYPFITFFVIICVFYYGVNDTEFNQLLLLYKNHNIIALFIEDLPILLVLILIYADDKQGIITLIFVSVLTFFKSLSIFNRYYYKNKFLYTMEDIDLEIVEYERAYSNSSSREKLNNNALDIGSQISFSELLEFEDVDDPHQVL